MDTPLHLLLPFRFDPALLKADLETVQRDPWTLHFNKGYYEGDWSGLALRVVPDAANPLYSNRRTLPEQFADTRALERCAYFQEVLRAFQCPLKAVRLLRLKAGSTIKEHADSDLGYDLGEIRFHIPVVTNPQVEFYLAGERIVMNEGECWYLDLSKLHRVQNLGSTDRVHLVIDGVLNDWARATLAAAAESQPAMVSAPSSAQRLEEFKDIVLDDLELQTQLRGILVLEEFVRKTVELGEARGYRFTAEDVQSAMRSAQRSWIERWVQ